MAAKKRRLFGLFHCKRGNPRKLAGSLRREIRELDKKIAGVEFDINRLTRERERIVQRGVAAANRTDTTIAQQAACDLRSINAEIGEVQRNRNIIMKSHLFCKISLRKLETALPGGGLEAVARVRELLDDESIESMLMDADLRREEFECALAKRLNQDIRDTDCCIAMDDAEVNDIIKTFERIGKAEVEGKMTEAGELKSALTGEPVKEEAVGAALEDF